MQKRLNYYLIYVDLEVLRRLNVDNYGWQRVIPTDPFNLIFVTKDTINNHKISGLCYYITMTYSNINNLLKLNKNAPILIKTGNKYKIIN